MPTRSRSEQYGLRASVASLGLMSDIARIKASRAKRVITFDKNEAEQRILADASVIPHQYSFLKNTSNRYIALCGGYGCGKTWSAVAKTIMLAFRSPGHPIIFLEPSIPLLDDIAIPEFLNFFTKYNIPYRFRRSPRPNFWIELDEGESLIYLRSFENYEKIVGINSAGCVIDEVDTVKTATAEKAVIKIQGRVRVGNCPQIAFASTPEGHKFLYQFFDVEADESKLLIKGKTRDNPYLREGFVEDLMQKYPPNLIEAYLEGEFVNLDTAVVFAEYNRKIHGSSVFQPDYNDIILVGADFNIKKGKSVYAVVRTEPQGQVVNVFHEYTAKDTYDLAAHIKRRFPGFLNDGRVICYPDATGARDYTSSTESDHDILRSHGIRVVANSKNPAIGEIVSHVNSAFHRGLIRINEAAAPELVRCCEQWGYDENLKPVKGGKDDLSNIGDALKYLIWGTVARPNTGLRSGARHR